MQTDPMSLNNIQLPPLVIHQMFEKTLISTPGSSKEITGNTNEINFLGGNASNIIIVVNNKDVVYLTENQLNFLTGILNACKLNLNDIAAVNFHQNKKLTYKNLTADLKAKVVLLFGVLPQQVDLPFTIPEFQIQSYNNQKYISAPELDVLENDVELKRKLWESLKQIFL